MRPAWVPPQEEPRSGWLAEPDPDDERRARPSVLAAEAVELVNAALLVTGPPGCGKSTLAYRVAYELGLGPVLRWPIVRCSTVTDGLYGYDAVGGPTAGRAAWPVRLGPLGTALLPRSRSTGRGPAGRSCRCCS